MTYFALAGDDPIFMLTAIIPATRKLLDRAGLSIDRVDAVNEAFASVVLAWMRATGADPDRFNRFGGAVALGHPVGTSGGRLLGNLLAALEDTVGRYGLQTMRESGGVANATLIATWWGVHTMPLRCLELFLQGLHVPRMLGVLPDAVGILSGVVYFHLAALRGETRSEMDLSSLSSSHCSPNNSRKRLH